MENMEEQVVQEPEKKPCGFLRSVGFDASKKTTVKTEIIAGIVFEPEVGAIYNAKVTRIIPIGAFVEYAPGREGLVHISKLAKERTEKVEDVCKEGDEFPVKFLGIDEKGRANLSRKDAL